MWNKRSNASGNTSSGDSKEVQKPSRVRLEPVDDVPGPQDVLSLLAQAQKNPGIFCELPIRSAEETYVLSCQSDIVSMQPCWTLYQGEDGNTQIWSYNDIDIDMLTNITSMSVMANNKRDQAKVDLSALSPAAPIAVTPDAAIQVQPVFQSATQPVVSTSAPAVANASVAPSPAAEQPGSVVIDAPTASPWGAAAAAASKSAEGTVSNPWRSPGVVAKGAGAGSADAFVRSLANRPGITISELTMDPALPNNCVDAVLKLQEMVLKGHFSEKTALEALKLAVHNDGVLDEGILSKVQVRPAGATDEGSRGAVQILQQAGLVTELDVAAAESASSKHAGDIGAALIAKGKIDELILAAAQRGHELIANGSLRADQIIIALHYCQRMRAKLDDALSDLNIETL